MGKPRIAINEACCWALEAMAASNCEDLTGVDGERQVVQRRFRGAPISEGEVLDVDDRVGHAGHRIRPGGS